MKMEPSTTTYGYHDSRFAISDDDFWFAFAIPGAIIVQVIVAVVISIIALGVSNARWRRTKQQKLLELENLQRTYQMRLDIFRQSHPESEEGLDAVAANELRNIRDNCQRITAEIMVKQTGMVLKIKTQMKKCCRIYSLYAYITFWLYLIYFILYLTTSLFDGGVFLFLFITSAVFLFVTHLTVFIEHFCSFERRYIQNLSSSMFAVQRIDAIRATQPSMVLVAECYHYETRIRTVDYYDAYGNRQTRQETYQAKMVTNLIREPVSFQSWRDTSTPELVGMNDKGITKIKMTLSVEPGDEETTAAIHQQFSTFHNNYRYFDQHVDFSIEKFVPGFEKRLAAYTDNREKPAWVSTGWFLAATLLCLSWPYRWAFNSITSKTEFTVSKLIYIRRREQYFNIPGVDTESEWNYAIND